MAAEAGVTILEYYHNSDPTYFGPKSCLSDGKPEVMLYTKF